MHRETDQSRNRFRKNKKTADRSTRRLLCVKINDLLRLAYFGFAARAPQRRKACSASHYVREDVLQRTQQIGICGVKNENDIIKRQSKKELEAISNRSLCVSASGCPPPIYTVYFPGIRRRFPEESNSEKLSSVRVKKTSPDSPGFR